MPKKPDDLNLVLDSPSKIAQSLDRITLKARQKTLGEAIIADLYDDLIGIVPIAGDALENGPRIGDAIQTKDNVAAIAHGTDALLTIVPGIGTILNFIPTNSLLKLMELTECNGELSDCLFPEDSIERDIINVTGMNVEGFGI
jgi:hypothetical protein